MINVYTRIASLVLAFGLFISCSTFQSANETSDTSENLSEKQLKKQLASVEEDIGNDSENPELYFKKGKLLTKLAQQSEAPSNRSTPYSEANEALIKATTLYSDSNDESNVDEVRDLLNVTWSLEHNQGVQLLQNENSNSPDFSRAAAHFNNATIIIPDSVVSYTMQARAQYQNQEPEQAITTLEKARERISDPPVELLEKLAFLYLENDQSQKAIAVYEEAESFTNQNLNLLHGLSNAYISAGKHDKAISLLEQLVEDEPQNIIYGQSLATEYYFLGKSKMDSVITALENDRSLENTQLDDAASLLKKSEEQFNRIVEANPGNEELMEHFAQFYHNSASKYQELVPLVSDEDSTELKEQIEQHLSASIPLLEAIVEQDPANQQSWEYLYRAYSILGMEQEAKNAKANI